MSKLQVKLQKRGGLILAWTIAAAWYIADVLYIWFNGNNLLNSDVAAELILAKELNKEGTLLSTNWYYSTELRVINTQLAYKLGFALFPDHWHAARTVAVAILLLVLILVAIYFSKAISYPLAGPILSVVMLAPYSCWYGWNVVFNSYYVPHIALTFLALTLFLRTLQTKGRRRAVCIVLSVALAFTASLGGVRQPMICYSPLLLAVVVYLLSGKEKKIDSHVLHILGYAFFLFVAACAGYLVNDKVLSRYYTFESKSTRVWNDLSLNNVLSCLSDLAALFGWRSDVPIVSLSGIGNILSLLLIAVLLFCTVKCYRKIQLDESEKLVLLFSISAFIVLLAIYGFAYNSYNESYWTLFLPYIFIGATLCLKHEDIDWKKYIVTGFCLVTVLINSLLTYQDPYISWVPNDLDIQNAVAWLVENGYTQGIAGFWDSDIITALSNGQIEMWTVGDVDEPQINEWLQVKSHNTYPEKGKIFIIRPMSDLTGQDPVINEYLVGTVDHLAYQDDNYFIYSFDSAEEYLDTMAEITANIEQ